MAFVRFEQPQNALAGTLQFDIIASVRLEQYENAEPPMFVTLFGIVMFARFVQF